ncbi:restriction endonuclease subunit S [Sporolactobacillus sp. Y61]|uniref:Restriction endonuclease subunit S n=1 Tax=Sporolactobacillus sp. Y61 TaxID=3160863 RepID=A0AAU8IHI5_9BACL
MSENNTNVPKIRFPGFTGDWKQRKLSEVMSDFIVPMRDKPKEFSGTIPWTRIEDIEGKYLNDSLSGQYVSEETIKKMNLRIIPKGSLIVSASATFGVVAVVTRDLITNQTFIGLVPKEDFDLDFLYTFFQSSTVQKKMRLESAGSTIFYISRQTFEDMKFPFPIKDEQKKIGAFFAGLDHLITLHQRKLNHLQDEKKSLLQKMFPKKGENVPEIRFPGFTHAWEQRKVNDLVTQVIRKVPKPDHPYERISVRSHAKGTFHQKVEDPKTVAMDKLFVVKENDLIVNITFAWEHAIAIANKSDNGLLVSHRFPTYRADGKSDINFLHYLVSREEFRRKLEFISPGGAGRNRVMNKKDFLKLKVTIPLNIEEQQKIGAFFKNLDHLITLHQRELDHCKKLKKALLQQMFV